MTINSYSNMISGTILAILPLLVIGVTIVLWLIALSTWITTLVILLTSNSWKFILIPVGWIFILADWVLSWSGPFIIDYFTRSSFFNWLNNLYLVIVLGALGFMVDKYGPNSSRTITSSISSSQIGKGEPISLVRTCQSSRRKVNVSNINNFTKSNGSGLHILNWISLAPLAKKLLDTNIPGLPVHGDEIKQFEKTLHDMCRNGKIRTRWHHIEKNLHQEASEGVLPDNINLPGKVPLGVTWIEVPQYKLWFSIIAVEDKKMSLPNTKKFEEAKITIISSNLDLFMLDAFAIEGKDVNSLTKEDVTLATQVALDIITKLSNQSLILHIFADQIEFDLIKSWEEQKIK